MKNYSQEELQDARAFIDDLRSANGGITKEEEEELDRLLPKVKEALENLQNKVGISTKILSEQLYQKSTRFIYEIIQNAEDNEYKGSKKLPFLSFTLYSDRLIIDSNEDGFTKENIKAICSIGESTKASIQGYIGEKGIGFKSVFTVAHKVHIQSGCYSFAFEYSKNDDGKSGLGMVTPMNETPHELPGDVQTRMILYLHAGEDCGALYQELLNLPDTLLLFLKKLRQLTVNFELPDRNVHQVQFSLTRPNNDRLSENIVQTKTAITGAVNSVTHKSFWVKKRPVFNLPADSARGKIREAEVILAFPIDEDHVPVIEEQYAFAFLPMKKTGYKFLIQSDFITKASREDIVDSAWNRQLLVEVVATFRSAINDSNGFLKHDTLRYSWIRYIPTTTITDEFWGLLQPRLLDELCKSKFFFSMDGSLWTPDRLRVLQNADRDENRDPLLADTNAGTTAYVSESYNASDITILEKMRAKHLDTEDFLQRLGEDLVRTHGSRMKTTPLNSSWHTRVADLLISRCCNESVKKEIQKLNIIPLDSGAWVRPLNASIFFPTSGGIDIPKGLPLNLVDKKSLGNLSRKQLFGQLGVSVCSPERIFPLIEQRHFPPASEFADSDLQDIRFLFWHHEALASDYSISMWLWNGERLSPHKINEGGWIYCMESNHAYATIKIIDKSIPLELKKDNHVRYPAESYYKALEACGVRSKRTGIQWLRSLGIKETPQLRCRRNVPGSQLSAEVKHIFNNLPKYTLGTLQANWSQYKETEPWDNFFKQKKVPILASWAMMDLKDTYLPVPKLKGIASSLGLEESFGFLEELDGISEAEVSKWNFLKRFGVGLDENVSFWLRLLKQAKQKDSTNFSTVFRIYTSLQTYIDEADIIKIKEAFEEDMIFVPRSNSMDDWEWKYKADCSWSGPEWYEHKPRLQTVNKYQKLQALFVNTLEISDATLSDFLDYLGRIKIDDQNKPNNESGEQKNKIILLYDKLNELAGSGENSGETEIVRSRIEEGKLLYYPPNKSWYAPSSCIWAPEDIQLPEKISIATEYKNRQSFFRNVLGVEKPSLEMHIVALQKRALENPDKHGILRELRNICALNPTAALRDKISKCKCLPVCRPSQEVEWMDSTDSFAIIDRKEHGDIFKNKINVLDFSLEEVHSVNQFLVELGLEGRYTSGAVKEGTKIEDGLLNDGLTKDLRRKAYAICRYAAHHGSKDATSAYDLLRNLEVFTSDSITKEVSIAQNKKITSVKVHTAFLHIAQDGHQLKLYVPKEQRHREVCLSRQLPIELLKHLGVPNYRKGAELGSIIRATSSFAIDAILDSDGIIDVPGIFPPEDYSESEASTFDTSQNIASPAINTEVESRVTSPEPHYHIRPSTEDRYVQAQFIDSSLWTPATSGSHTPEILPDQPDLFNELLDTVIRQARSVHSIPEVDDVLIAPLSTNSHIDTGLAVGSNVAGESLFRIGVAGELFMFEILKSLGLPLFDLGNWRSTIRHRVAAHDDYKDMPRWSGSETSDIVYEDHDKMLTSLLTTNNYFHIEELAGLRFASSPTYYIEVKTTPGPLDNAFYCSQGQFDRMESMKLQSDELVNEVYLVARVFNLGASGIGFKLYVDPAGLRRRGQLKFAADKYVVTS
ncbi:hypothetical protein BCIN_01g09700 [Botrytis cinerea B05.10]|uniref:Protein NO VEIN C-terminal domain-containing protein n=1 Tax=Botryotinia fuckeliana (strain B05.10) TaxID=332648 RepID=A0A384J749_BOTFB|nr:hypothetical protein BCIN_01g09700 [Botrytis cinerea B05.10]ATZ46359.1 hypothetical protein BCIN_01g09700 [Botrytis cinerea B05.10]